MSESTNLEAPTKKPQSINWPYIGIAVVLVSVASLGSYQLGTRSPSLSESNQQNQTVGNITPTKKQINSKSNILDTNSRNVPSKKPGLRIFVSYTYDYSFEYPNSWIVSEGYTSSTSENPLIYHDISMGMVNTSGFGGGGESIIIQVRPIQGTDEALARQMLGTVNELVYEGEIDQNGSHGKKWSSASKSGRRDYALIFNKNNKRYIIFTATGTDNEVNQVMSSFTLGIR